MWPRGNVLVDSDIRKLMSGPRPSIATKGTEIPPSSLDMAVGERVWQVSGLPTVAGGFDFKTFIDEYAINEIPHTKRPWAFTPGSIYFAELEPKFRLPECVGGVTNAKSSAGRIDLYCPTVANGCDQYNVVPAGYKGKLYMLMVPQSFSFRGVRAHEFVQIRLNEGERQYLQGLELQMLHDQYKLVLNRKPVLTQSGLMLHLDLRNNLVATKNGKPIDLNRRDINPRYYFRRKLKDAQGRLFLEPGEFLLANTMEYLRIPDKVCAEMEAHDEKQGEMRTHYAGFFDPNFEGNIVCEIRNIGTAPIILSHGQPIALVRYEALRSRPVALYGQKKSGAKVSNYQGQRGIRLAKYFAPWAA